MNLIHIRSKSMAQINEIIDMLLEEKLILDPTIIEQVYLRKKNQSGAFENDKQFLLIAKARALLFSKIEHLLREKYAKKMPDLYSLPIVNMDWKKAENLQNIEVQH
jgi:uncharacterized protein involved in tolerance to divalent cations